MEAAAAAAAARGDINLSIENIEQGLRLASF
jgi:hypothetical protein